MLALVTLRVTEAEHTLEPVDMLERSHLMRASTSLPLLSGSSASAPEEDVAPYLVLGAFSEILVSATHARTLVAVVSTVQVRLAGRSLDVTRRVHGPHLEGVRAVREVLE